MNAPGSLLKFVAGALGKPALADHLGNLLDELKAEPQKGSNAPETLEQRWLHTLVGDVVQWALLKAALENLSGGEDLHARTMTWCTANLSRAMTRVRDLEGRMEWNSAAERLADQILAYHKIIGDIDQTAAGENTEVDRLLRRTVPDENLAGVAGGGGAPDFPGGDEPVIEDAQTAQVWIFLSEWLQKHLRLEAKLIGHGTRFAAVGLSSLQAAALTMDLGDRFGVDVDMSAAWDYPTVESLARAVAKMIADESESATETA
jgi:acyl carrier protein